MKKLEKNLMGSRTAKDKCVFLALEKINQEQSFSRIITVEVNIGYIFENLDEEIEALLRVKVESMQMVTIYVSIKGDKCSILDLTEAGYKSNISNMEALHPCIAEDVTEETKIKARREINNAKLSKKLIDTNDELVAKDFDIRHTIFAKSTEAEIKEFFVKKTIAMIITTKAMKRIYHKTSHRVAIEEALNELKAYNIENRYLNLTEKKVYNDTIILQDFQDLDWSCEKAYIFLWAIGLINTEEVENADVLCDFNQMCEKILSFNNFSELMNVCCLRSYDDILDIHDLYFRYHWALEKQKIYANTKIGNLDYMVVKERRIAFEWLLSNVTNGVEDLLNVNWNYIVMNA